MCSPVTLYMCRWTALGTVTPVPHVSNTTLVTQPCADDCVPVDGPFMTLPSSRMTTHAAVNRS